ncbi:MAG TPA: HEAT repeat domain-containing protein, partial [Acidobacteriota bacterium]|nr:HEAT repeat domain-containing protein [Acidobacteriota bacterium]
MKKRIAALVLAVAACALLAAGQSASPAGAEALKARVSSLVDRFPAETPAAKDALCADLVKLGPAALAETCARVLPPGSGDDSKARFAVNGLAVYVTRAGAGTERLLFTRTLLAALAAKPDKQVASFLMSQIQLTGKTEAVKPLAGYLKDDALAGPAAAALQAIGGPEAARGLLKGLDTAPQGARVSIVDALGGMRSRESVKKLLALAESNDEGLRRAARSALANIGDPSAGPALSRIRVATSQGERAQAPGLYLLFARRLAESGHTADALAAARSILDSHNGPGDSHVASDALALLVSILKDKAVPDLLAAADSPVLALRCASLEMAATVGKDDVTARWVEKARVSGPEVRAGIVTMLGRRGDKTALPYVRESLRSSDGIVRLAAIPAAVKLGGDVALPDLFALTGSGDERTIAAIKTSLLGFDGRQVVPEAVRLLDGTSPPGKAALIDVIGEKGAKPEIERIFALASDPEPGTRAASLGALAKLGGETDLPRLVGLLERATDGDDVVRLQEAVAAAARRSAAPADRGAA